MLGTAHRRVLTEKVRWIAALLIVVAAAYALMVGTGVDLSSYMDVFTETVRGSGAVGALASLGLMTLHGLLPIPIEILSAVNSSVFGLWFGVALTWLGLMLAAWTGYGVAYLSQGFVQKFVSSSRIERASEWVGRGGWWKLLVARQMPFVSFWAMNLGMGILKVPFFRFTWTTALGNVPYVIVISIISSSVT